MMFKARIVVFTFISLLLLSFKAGDQPLGEDRIKWLTFEEAVALSKKKPKKLLVDVYTDWCGWCKRMDKATYENPEIVKLVNKHYYAVKFNAEQREKIVFNDKEFVFKPEQRAHELALSLLAGKMAYPSTVFLDEKFALLTNVQGYIAPDQMKPILSFFAEKIYEKKTWDDYQKDLQTEKEKQKTAN